VGFPQPLKTGGRESTTEASNVLIVDPQRTFADAVAAWLGNESDAAVVKAVYSPQSARCVLATSRVDLLLVGDLPDRAALTLCMEVSAREYPPRVIVISASADVGHIVAAIQAGANAWVCKDESGKHLLDVIGRVVRGETWVPPSELGQVFRLMLSNLERMRQEDPLVALTPRERDVLLHVAEGADRKEVAERLHLSVNTVRTHMQSLMAKLGVHSTLEAVAVTRAWLDVSPPQDRAPVGDRRAGRPQGSAVLAGNRRD
jgi:DNA-binding NarL/FixJ family response regulator